MIIIIIKININNICLLNIIVINEFNNYIGLLSIIIKNEYYKLINYYIKIFINSIKVNNIK